MRTYEILYNGPGTHSSEELTKYVHNRIDQISQDFSMVERCEVTLHKHPTINNGCEVKARLYVPRHVYSSKENRTDFKLAVQNVFDDLHQQLVELKERMYDKAIQVAPAH